MSREEAERAVLESLRAVGVDADSIWDLLNKYRRIPDFIVSLLLEALPQVKDDWVRESIVRVLAVAKGKFDGSFLVRTFEESNNELLRWAIANTFAEAQPDNVSEWVYKAVTNRSFGKSREMLVVALARLRPREEAVPVLKNLFDEFPGHVAMALGQVGGEAEMSFLKEKLLGHKGWVKKRITSAIKRIENRKAKGDIHY